MKADRYEAYVRYMNDCMRDSAHDAGHIYRVLHAALVLSAQEKNVDRDVLIAAALLHDVGREEQFRTGESHASIGARMAAGFLAGRGEEKVFIEHVCACIRTHSFRKNDPPASVEAQLLYDADKLDVVGAMGVARTFLYQGRMDEPVYSVGPDGNVLSGEEKTPSFFSEYTNKLSRLGPRFQTEAGKRAAAERAEAAARFDQALRAEVSEGESGPAWHILPETASAEQRRALNLALLLGGEAVSRETLAALVMKKTLPEGRTAEERLVLDAVCLDAEGALGIARRLMEVGAARGDMRSAWKERPAQAYHTAQARGMAQARRQTEAAFQEALRREESGYGAQAEAMLSAGLVE